MKKKILPLVLLICSAFCTKAQILDTFTITLQPSSNKYLSIVNKTAYSNTEAKSNKEAIDLALVTSSISSSKKMEWYNMSGKDNLIPKELTGTNTLINAISFDREQFDKCITVADLKRMTGYITSNAFSHFSVIRNGNDYYQRCFLFQKANGKRGLLFVTLTENSQLKVEVKAE